MYKINDIVMYGTFGICKITAIEKRDLTGEEREYYILRQKNSEKRHKTGENIKNSAKTINRLNQTQQKLVLKNSREKEKIQNDYLINMDRK